MRGEHQILAFNRGLLSRLAMARVDLRRYPMAAAEQKNLIPRVLGSAMLRPGWQYLGATKSNAAARYLDFIFASDDTALIELTASVMRIWVNEAQVTRPSVTTAIANGTFTGSLASWTDIDQTTQTVSQYVTGDYMGLGGYAGSYAGRRQAVTVPAASRNIVHGLRVVVERGQVDVRVGSTAGGEEYFRVTLGRGTHSLAFTPTGDISIDILGYTEYESLVDSCTIEASGVLELPTPWGASDLSLIRKDQSGDVIYLASRGKQQRKIERRGTTSWSIVYYEPENGPFMPINTSATTISNTSIRGTTTLTASQPVFKSTHVGALFRLESNGQDVDKVFTALNDVSDQILVTGTGSARAFTVVLTFGGAVQTITLQRSIGNTGIWEDTTTTYTADTTASVNDALDNQIVAYRLKCTAYTSGSVNGQLRYRYGSIKGVVRIISVASPTSAQASVLKTLGNIGTVSNSATTDWSEGRWSDYRGWPSAVGFYEGRLWWAGKDKWYGSVTDDFANFDPDYAGDAGPISRSIGAGPVDTINWLLALQRLIAGTDGSLVSGRSSSFDEPLTPSNFNPKEAATQGSARIQALKVDDTGVFVQRGGYRVLSMAPSAESMGQYAMEDLTQLVPEVCSPGIVALGIQRQPDTRIHCVRSDGTVALMVYDKTEDVKCWITVVTSGTVEDVVVLPGTGGEDNVYYVVARTINGATSRYLEKWARESECVGGNTSKLQDSFVTYNGSNLTHLEGQAVVGWYNGTAYTGTVSGGAAAGIPSGATVGLSYEFRFKSTKLAFLAQPGESGLPSKKKGHSLALVLADTHPLGIQYGQDFSTMDTLPLTEAFADVDLNAMYSEYNYEAFTIPGTWTVDARLCLKGTAPYPCTVLGAVVGMSSNATT